MNVISVRYLCSSRQVSQVFLKLHSIEASKIDEILEESKE